jgi:hypothetical protein
MHAGKKYLIMVIILSSLLFLLGLSNDNYGFFNNFILAVSVNLLIFVIPGISFLGFIRKRHDDLVQIILYVLLISTVIDFVGIALFWILGIHITKIMFFVYLVVVSFIGISFSKNIMFDINFKINKKIIYTSIFFLIIFSSLVYSASTIPKVDWKNKFDLPHKGLPDKDKLRYATAYGLIYHLTPYTFIEFAYYFQHQVNMHFYAAYSILLTGHLDYDKLTFHDDLLSFNKQQEAHIYLAYLKLAKLDSWYPLDFLDKNKKIRLGIPISGWSLTFAT